MNFMAWARRRSYHQPSGMVGASQEWAERDEELQSVSPEEGARTPFHATDQKDIMIGWEIHRSLKATPGDNL